MAGPYGNSNVPFLGNHQFITFGAASDESAALAKTTQQVTLYATAACWVIIGEPGKTATAVENTTEKTTGKSFYLPASVLFDVAVRNSGRDDTDVNIAAVDVTAGSGGNLHIYERTDS